MLFKVDHNENGQKQSKCIKMKMVKETIAGASVCSSAQRSTYITAFNSMVLVWTAENASKWQGRRELIHAFSMKIKTHTFENTLVWMGPRSVADLWEGLEGDLNLHFIFRSN